MPPLRLASVTAGELAESLAALRTELGLTAAFAPEVEREAARAVAAAALPEHDRTDIPFVTIDPAGATDLDQALHIERRGEGYRVYYAIADVPAFVEPAGAVDAEARRRGQTMYAADGRIPLHPSVIGEDAASLLPDRVRGAFVWEFTLAPDATVVGVAVATARVRSRRQWSYVEAQAALDASRQGGDGVFELLREVGDKRLGLERARGGASLNRPDQEVERRDGEYVLSRRMALPIEGWNAQISLMTGMAAAKIMIEGGVGILRTMPAPDAETLARFRRQTAALGTPWPANMPYGEYLRTLGPDDPRQVAIVHAAGSLFRGARYTAFDGSLPEATEQAAVAAPYAHVTAPLRRLVDRFVLVACEALSAGSPVPAWVREALPALPGIMARSDDLASRLDRGSIDAVEAAVLRGRVGEVFAATAISARDGGGVVQLSDPAVTGECTGRLEAGSPARVVLVTADVAARRISFRTVD